MAASFSNETGGSTNSVLQNYYGLAQVPFEGVLIEVYKGTRRKLNMKFRHIGHTSSQYGQSFFPKSISAWNRIAFAEGSSLAVSGYIWMSEMTNYPGTSSIPF